MSSGHAPPSQQLIEPLRPHQFPAVHLLVQKIINQLQCFPHLELFSMPTFRRNRREELEISCPTSAPQTHRRPPAYRRNSPANKRERNRSTATNCLRGRAQETPQPTENQLTFGVSICLMIPATQEVAFFPSFSRCLNSSCCCTWLVFIELTRLASDNAGLEPALMVARPLSILVRLPASWYQEQTQFEPEGSVTTG